MFSSRLPRSMEPNAIALAVSSLLEQGAAFTDLTESNPTRAGLSYPAGLLESLEDPAALVYDPEPLGLPSARRAVADDYARRGVDVEPRRIVLTASSSESYSILFKLLCDPGDNVLVPVPSYPLFEHLASLEAVCIRPYRLEYHTGGTGVAPPGAWTFDIEEIAGLVDERTRAVLVVTPNNPSGSLLGGDELVALTALAAERDLVVISDEVFADYLVHPRHGAARSVLELSGGLCIALGGLSKSAGLPQLKLGWMALAGSPGAVDGALQRLEVICDTYLSVSTPVQVALPRLMEAGAQVRRQIQDRLLLNYRQLTMLAGEYPSCRVPRVEGGWSAVVQAPATVADEARVLQLLRETGVLVHPGYFFDFDRDGYFVLSLLVPPAEFRPAVKLLFDALDRT